MVRVGILVYPDFIGKVFSFSPLSIVFAVGLSQMAFIMLRNVPSIPSLVSFYHEGMLDFIKCFFCINLNDHVVSTFLLLMWCIALIDFCMLNDFCDPGLNPT